MKDALFSKRFANLIERLIKVDPTMKPHLSALNMTTFIAPVIACDEALLEVEFMRDTDLELLDCLKKVLSGEADERTEEHIFQRESVLDNVQKEVSLR